MALPQYTGRDWRASRGPALPEVGCSLHQEGEGGGTAPVVLIAQRRPTDVAAVAQRREPLEALSILATALCCGGHRVGHQAQERTMVRTLTTTSTSSVAPGREAPCSTASKNII